MIPERTLKFRAALLVPIFALSLGCAGANQTPSAAERETVPEVHTAVSEKTTVEVTDEEYFTDRDKEQIPDLKKAIEVPLSDGRNIKINAEGVYVLKGSAKDVTVTVAEENAKVQLVLDGAEITNTDKPCIYVESADKVFITTAAESENNLKVTGTFQKDDNTKADAVIFSRDDLVLNGTGSLTVESTDNGIASNDDLKVTGGTLLVNAGNKGLDAKDRLLIADGNLTINATDDGLHAENSDDDNLGMIYIGGGVIKVTCTDDAVHAVSELRIDGGILDLTGREGLEATSITINDGSLTILADDDGINAGKKSSTHTVQITVNGGTIKITLADEDSDGIDTNGSLTVSGGTIDITGGNPFDCKGRTEYSGGTIRIDGEAVNSIPVKN